MQERRTTCSGGGPIRRTTVNRSGADPDPHETFQAAPLEDGGDLDGLHQETTANPVILIVVSSVIGFGLAVVSAWLGSGLWMSFLVYLFVSISIFTAVFGLSCFAARPIASWRSAVDAPDLLECEISEVTRVLWIRNRLIRIWWVIIICALFLAMRFSDAIALHIAVCAIGVVGWMWLLYDRSRPNSQRVAATRNRARGGE